MSDKYREVFRLLQAREQMRGRHAVPNPPTETDLQREMYSVTNSFKYQAMNRYSNILSYDKTSVKVKGKGYINANIVVGRNGHWWVAAQAPLPSDFGAYISALYSSDASQHPNVPNAEKEHNSVIIVQLSGYREGGRPKADRYLPLFKGYKGGPQLLLATQSVDRIKDLSCDLTRALIYPVHGGSDLTHEGELRKDLWHYYYDAWPDHGVPEGKEVERLRNLVYEVGKKREELGDCEVWVHCSAGVGRTGTFIALSSLLLPPKRKIALPESPLGPLPEQLRGDAVAETVDEIREWRGMLVQNEEQLRLIYELTR